MSSIRHVVPIVISIQIVVAVGITNIISFYSSEHTVQKLTKNLCDNLSHRVEQNINSYLKDSVQINQALATALTNGSVNPNDINQVQREIFNKSREFNTQNILFFGHEKGSMVGIERQAPSSSKFLLRIRDESTIPNRPTYELSSNGERGKLVTNEVYDHRNRPWYVAAKQSGKAIWSSIFVSTTDGELTTTYATPIYNSDGILQGVTGINISLKQIKQHMLAIRPTDKWQVFLVEENGNLVASTSEEPIFSNQGNRVERFEISQSKNSKLQKAGLSIKENLGGFKNIQEEAKVIEFEVNGEKYIVSTHKLSKDSQLDWTVGIIVPKSIFMKEIDDNNRVTLIIIVIMLGINILIGLAIASWLLGPIKNLMIAAKEIEEDSFNPEGLETITTRKDELGQMARVFQEMGSTIAERNHGLKTQLNKLREDNDEAKKAAMNSSMGSQNSLKSILSRSRAARSK
ncbi:PDC sensor domain-containing protein [Pseudanabaena yagii]|uniref:HAMP domain-containing protein n=1 Tax=Pseudanabaena yagii GIHE-NHR1 TaxID=2722753 RepID=A0ABX1LU78_9CYAN|nr:cache domain-containing protein [Pseudanabaena yagii]NMF59702.1 HAMP domain-containing protein [Pseudanabaena yagii GIHE-NHR1]